MGVVARYHTQSRYVLPLWTRTEQDPPSGRMMSLRSPDT